MPAEKFEIIFYLSTSGVECRVEYSAKENYDAARIILDSHLDPAPICREGKTVVNAAYYYVERAQLDSFYQCLQAIPKEE